MNEKERMKTKELAKLTFGFFFEKSFLFGVAYGVGLYILVLLLFWIF